MMQLRRLLAYPAADIVQEVIQLLTYCTCATAAAARSRSPGRHAPCCTSRLLQLPWG